MYSDNVWDLYFCSIVSMRCHPGNKDVVSLEECAIIADEMVDVRMFHVKPHQEFNVMATAQNPFAHLIRMVEQRIARQEAALAESRLQLESARVAYNDHEKNNTQKDLVSELKPSQRGGTRST